MQFTIATTRQTTARNTSTFRSIVTSPTVRLWTAQATLAALFAFAGAIKLVAPVDAAVESTGLAGWFIRFIGVCEVLGAAGLILPQLTGIRRALTPLAAAGLVVIMAGATVITAIDMPAAALSPFVVGLLATYVAAARGRQVLRTRSTATISTR